MSHPDGRRNLRDEPLQGLCRLPELHRAPREVLQALVHLFSRPLYAALHGRIREGQTHCHAHEIIIGKYLYQADISGEAGWVIEKGPKGQKKYPMEQAIGGKYVYYFLTTLERGKLQTLPVAYDVKRKEWFDKAASGIRHPLKIHNYLNLRAAITILWICLQTEKFAYHELKWLPLIKRP